MSRKDVDRLFELSPDVSDIIPDSFAGAASIASAIVRSLLFAECLHQLSATASKTKVEKFFNCLYQKNMPITLYQCENIVTRCVSVSLFSLPLLDMKRSENELKVKLLLLHSDINELTKQLGITTDRKKRTRTVTAIQEQITQKEQEIAALDAKLALTEQCHVIIIAVKLVHLLSCIVSNQFSKVTTLKTPVKMTDNCKFDDIGDLIEKSLFGGIIQYGQRPSDSFPPKSNAFSCDFRDSEFCFLVTPADNVTFLKILSPADVTQHAVLLKRSPYPIRIRSSYHSGSRLYSHFVENLSESEKDSSCDEITFDREIFIEEPEQWFFKA
jgi:hypothetical protein